jgi:hypothetical protein
VNDFSSWAAHNRLTENFSLHIASKYEIPSNMNIIYWNSGLNAGGSRIFIVTILRAPATIKSRQSGKKNSNLTKFGANLIFSPPLRPMYYFSYFLEISPP